MFHECSTGRQVVGPGQFRPIGSPTRLIIINLLGPLMELSGISTLLYLGVVLAIAIGVGLIIRTGAILTGLGVVLVIAGLMGLMPALRYHLRANQPTTGE